MAGNATGCMGLADYLGWDFRSKAGIPIVNVPGCPIQPDNFMETLSWLLLQAAGKNPMIPLDQQLRPTWLFGKRVHEGCDRAGYYEQGEFPRLQLAQVPGEGQARFRAAYRSFFPSRSCSMRTRRVPSFDGTPLATGGASRWSCPWARSARASFPLPPSDVPEHPQVAQIR